MAKAILESKLFRGDKRLQDCLKLDSEHVPKRPNERGLFVAKIHQALSILRESDSRIPRISADEERNQEYGPDTVKAVKKYKTDRSIINFSYQNSADHIVGKMTIERLDDDMLDHELGRRRSPIPIDPPTERQIIARAFERSRASLRNVAQILQNLENEINRVDGLSGAPRAEASASLQVTQARNIQVLARRLLVNPDPLSTDFRSALRRTQDLIRKNLAATSTIVNQGRTGRCDPSLPQNNGGVPHAAANRTDPDPRVSVCDTFFRDNQDLQRDALTHEWFHLVGLADVSVPNTAAAFNNANTMAQVVAFINDRDRQVNSDGGERAEPPLPSP